MTVVLMTGVLALLAVLTIASLWSGRTPSRRQVGSRKQRSSGADPYAADRGPEKLNPGLGGCASGGGGG